MRAELHCDDVRVELSARLDGEDDRKLAERVDEHLVTCAACRAHADELTRVRTALRLGAAEAVPDLTDAILERVETEGPRGRRRDRWLARTRTAAIAAAAAALVIFVSSLPLREGDLLRPSAITRGVRGAARDLTAYHATFRILERGWHALVPERRFRAEIWFRAPERLRLTVRDLTAYPDPGGWPRNDVDLVANPKRWWISESSTCPPATLPDCGPTRVEQRTVIARPPFDGETQLPTDIVLPVETLAQSEGVAVLGEGTVAGRAAHRIALPYRAAAPLLRSLQPGGDWRLFHPLDRVVVWLDRSTWFPLRVTVAASASPERADWAARHGLRREAAGRVLFEARALRFEEPERMPEKTFSVPVGGLIRDGRFSPAAVVRMPRPLDTAGLHSYRSGRIGARRVQAFAQGLSWLRVSSEPSRAAGPPLRAEEVRLSNGGWGYYLPSAGGISRRLDLYGRTRHVILETNLSRAELLRVAASVPLEVRRAPQVFRSAGLVVRRLRASIVERLPLAAAPHYLPEGYRARVATLARSGDNVRTLIVYFRRAEAEFDGIGIRITQSPADRLPPTSERLMSVRVGGTLGRWSPERGELEWVDHGVYRAVAVPSFDLGTALRIAEGLR